MKANALLKHNILTLLRARGHEQKDLAQWCRKSESWLSQILSQERREFQTKDFDRIADFFGIATYQLFQPGITRFTERRSGLERRATRDRRISKALQLDAPPPPHPMPAEWTLISKYRQLTADERVKLDGAVDLLLLTQGVEATTRRAGTRKDSRSPGVLPPPAIRRRKSGGGPDDAGLG